MTTIRDIDIRRTLEAELVRVYGTDKETLLVHELGLCSGSSRVDIAIVNGALHGFEIKSEADTLERLPSQIGHYCRVFDFVTIVSSGIHMAAIERIVPAWWGIQAARPGVEFRSIALEEIRQPTPNPSVEARAVAQLLWREEALDILTELGCVRGLLSKPRRVVWDAVAARLTIEDLKRAVRTKLKQRGPDWRAGELRIGCDV